jgi:hypothetical protein
MAFAMKITVSSQWRDETQSILLHQNYRGNWTLDDHYELVDETTVLLDNARHPADIVIDFTETTVPVSRLLSVVNLIVLNYVNGRVHNRQRITVVVGSDPSLQALVNMGARVGPSRDKKLLYSGAFGDCIGLIRAHSALQP